MSKQSASIEGVATLYVRNVPAEMYAKLQALADEEGRSLNATILAFLADQIGRLERRAAADRLLAEVREKNTPVIGPPWPEDIIREHRYGREPGFE